jgi:hypothetical protein
MISYTRLYQLILELMYGKDGIPTTSDMQRHIMQVLLVHKIGTLDSNYPTLLTPGTISNSKHEILDIILKTLQVTPLLHADMNILESKI